MIVVDTNIVMYLLLTGEHTESARSVFQRDPLWAAPLLWRSELRNVLSRYVRQGHLPLTDALVMQRAAEELFAGHEYPVDSSQVLEAAYTSGCVAYDCEFVTLARLLNVPLVTSDKQILAAFPGLAVGPQAFGTVGGSTSGSGATAAAVHEPSEREQRDVPSAHQYSRTAAPRNKFD